MHKEFSQKMSCVPASSVVFIAFSPKRRTVFEGDELHPKPKERQLPSIPFRRPNKQYWGTQYLKENIKLRIHLRCLSLCRQRSRVAPKLRADLKSVFRGVEVSS